MGASRERLPRDELRFVVVTGVLVVLAVAAVTAVAYVFAGAVGAEFSELSRDPSGVAGVPPYTGYYANLTILIWQVPATVALFASALLYRLGEREASRMLFAGGLITTAMVIDDFFQVHEVLDYRLDIPGALATVAYGLATIGFAWRFRRRLGVHLLVLVAAFGCWGLSAAIDTVMNDDAPYVVEDGMKLVGVGLWALLLLRVAFVELGAAVRRGPVIHAYVDGSARPSDGARHRAAPGRPALRRVQAEILAAPTPEPEVVTAPRYPRPMGDRVVPDVGGAGTHVPVQRPTPVRRPSPVRTVQEPIDGRL